MKTKITINFTNICNSKPKTAFEKQRESLNTNTALQIDPLLFAELMIQKRSFCPAIFKGGKRKNENWLGQGVFCLDFDSGILPEEVIERCKEHKLIINCLYTSFSDTPELRKFRVCFFFNCFITVQEKAKELQETLLDLFPESDQCVRDSARLFFPAKEVIFVEEELNDIFQVAPLVLARRERLKQDEHKQVEQGVKGQASPSQKSSDEEKKKSKLKINKKNFDFNLAIERVKILKDFVECKWLYHNVLFGLATNLKYIDGGLDWMREMMEASGQPYGWDKFKLIEDVRNSNYKSQRLNSFSPYKESYDNIFQACLK